MRPTLYYLRPRSTRSRPAPLVPGSLAWTIAELYRAPMQTLRDTDRAFMGRLHPLSPGALRVATDPGYTPVWSAAEAEMTRFVDDAPA